MLDSKKLQRRQEAMRQRQAKQRRLIRMAEIDRYWRTVQLSPEKYAEMWRYRNRCSPFNDL